MQIDFYFAMIILGRTEITILISLLQMKCCKVTHRYHSLRHIKSVENPSLPAPLSFFSQNYGGSRSLLRLGEGPATKERS